MQRSGMKVENRTLFFGWMSRLFSFCDGIKHVIHPTCRFMALLGFLLILLIPCLAVAQGEQPALLGYENETTAMELSMQSGSEYVLSIEGRGPDTDEVTRLVIGESYRLLLTHMEREIDLSETIPSYDREGIIDHNNLLIQGMVKGIAAGDVRLDVLVLDNWTNVSIYLRFVESLDDIDEGGGDPDIPVESVFIQQPSSTPLTVGETLQLEASIYPENATNPILTWQSSDERIAPVDVNGEVQALGAGRVIITASASNGVQARIELAVTAPTPDNPVRSVKIVPTFNQNVHPGAEVIFNAEVTTTNGNSYPVEWRTQSSSTVASIASLNPGSRMAVLTAHTAGSVSIIASANGIESKAYAVDIYPQVTGIRIMPPATTRVEKGAVLQLTATVEPLTSSSSPIIWQSSNEQIAKVDQNGRVECVGNKLGNVIITAVPQYAAGPHVVDAVSLNVGSPAALRVTLTPTSNNQGVISSGSQSIAKYTVQAGSEITLRAAFDGLEPGVLTDPSLQWRVISGKVTLSGGGVHPQDAWAGPITVPSSDSVVTVHCAEATTDAEVMVHHPASGATTRFLVDVQGKIRVYSVQMQTPQRDTLKIGETLQLYANAMAQQTGKEPTHKKLIWTSSDTQIATVDNLTGWVRAVSGGSVTIMAASEDDPSKYASIKLTVYHETGHAVNQRVLSRTLTVRAQPHTGGKIVNLYNPLKLGDSVQVLEKTPDGRWLRIVLSEADRRANGLDQNVAYVAFTYVGEPKDTSIKSLSLAVRQNPGTDQAVLGRLALGDRVQSLSKQGAWMGILYGGKVAYVSAKHTTQELSGQVQSNTLKVRGLPQVGASIVGGLHSGDRVEVLGREGHWYRIMFNGRTGYAAAGHIQLTD